MKQFSIEAARRVFDSLGKGEGNILSPCCSATVYQTFSACCNCGGVVAVPFYLISNKPIPDELAIDCEKVLRASEPKGAALAVLVRVP